MRAGGGLGTLRFSITSALLRRGNGDLVLVDGGFSREEMSPSSRRLQAWQRQLLLTRGGVERSAVAQIEAAGLDPARVTHVIATHMHMDHIGAYADFPNAQVVSTEAEFQSGRSRGVLKGYMHIDDIESSGRAQPVSLIPEDRDGFPAHLDLFGDGQVVLMDTRGHSAGSVAVLLIDPDSGRRCLMAGDAAYSAAEYRRGKKPFLQRLVGFSDDWMRASWRHLRDFETNHPDTPVILSHAPENDELVSDWSVSAAAR